MNSNLINIIVKGRQDSKLKQSEVGKLLGIKGNTISDWERGRTEPDIDSYIKLCKIYDINPAEALNSVYGLNDNEDFLLTKFETSHIKKYRTLDTHGKDMVDTVLGKEYDRCQILPDQAREERAEYNVVRLPYPDNRASAGTGDEFLSDVTRSISVKENRLTVRADLVIKVDGESMEPLYSDGDLVLVHRQPAVEIGAIGIYATNGKGYIKKQGKDRLISVNPAYPDITPEDSYIYKCFGEVIGKLDPEWIV